MTPAKIVGPDGGGPSRRRPVPPQPGTGERILARLRAEAEQLIRSEPCIAGYIHANVIGCRTLPGVIVQRLAARLAHPDVPQEFLRQIFSRLVQDDAAIPAAFERDLIAVVDRDPACRRFLEPVLHFKGFHAIQTHRLTHALWRQGRRDLALYLQSRSSSVFQTDIHPSAGIGSGLLLDHATGLVIAAGATVEDDVSILHNVSIGASAIVRRGSSLGAGSKIAAGVAIGSCVRVAAGSVVMQAVEDNRTVAGSPARIVAIAGCLGPARSFDELLAAKLEAALGGNGSFIL